MFTISWSDRFVNSRWVGRTQELYYAVAEPEEATFKEWLKNHTTPLRDWYDVTRVSSKLVLVRIFSMD